MLLRSTPPSASPLQVPTPPNATAQATTAQPAAALAEFHAFNRMIESSRLGFGHYAMAAHRIILDELHAYRRQVAKLEFVTGYPLVQAWDHTLADFLSTVREAGLDNLRIHDETSADSAVQALHTALTDSRRIYAARECKCFNTLVAIAHRTTLAAASRKSLARIINARRRIGRHLQHFMQLHPDPRHRLWREGVLQRGIDINTLLLKISRPQSPKLKPIFDAVPVHLALAPLPACCGDSFKLMHAFGELINNAASATTRLNGGSGRYHPRHGRAAVSITTAHNPRANEILIGIADNGIGMCGEQIARNRRIGSSQARDGASFGGMGLGIPVAELTLREHGGSMRIESTPAAGTHVTLRLPVRS